MEIKELYSFQKPATDALEIAMSRLEPTMLLAPAGTGKTHAECEALARNQAEGRLRPSKSKPINGIWLTVKRGVVQTQRVINDYKIKGCKAASYRQLTAGFGEHFIDWVSRYRGGDIELEPNWHTLPDYIIADEPHKIKNHNTQAARLLDKYVDQGGLLYPCGATPFSKLSETKIITKGLRLATDATWLNWMEHHCARGAKITDRSPQSMANYNKWLMDNGKLIKFTNIRFKHRTHTRAQLINFRNSHERHVYETFVEEWRKARKENPGQGGVYARWVADNKYREASQIIRAEQSAEIGYQICKTEGRQVLFASDFKEPLRVIWKTLVNKCGVNKDRIAIIIGNQTESEGQENIDRFQRGDADYILFTLKSGGACLNLNHDNPAARPRHCIIPPTWSPIDLIQVLGRAHRINSISVTYQDIVWYRDTIEERVKERVESGMKCLAELIGRRESWADIFRGESDDAVDTFGEDQREQDEEDETILFAAEAFEEPSAE